MRDALCAAAADAAPAAAGARSQALGVLLGLASCEANRAPMHAHAPLREALADAAAGAALHGGRPRARARLKRDRARASRDVAARLSSATVFRADGDEG